MTATARHLPRSGGPCGAAPANRSPGSAGHCGASGPHLRQHRLRIAVGFVALAADVLFRLLEPWPVKLVVDAVSRSLGATLRRPGPALDASLETLLLCGGAIVVISVLRAIANYWSAISFALVGSRVAADLRARTFRHVQGLSMRHHTRASSGDTVQRLVGDVSRLQDVAVTAGLPMLGNAVTLLAMIDHHAVA